MGPAAPAPHHPGAASLTLSKRQLVMQPHPPSCWGPETQTAGLGPTSGPGSPQTPSKEVLGLQRGLGTGADRETDALSGAGTALGGVALSAVPVRGSG